MTWPPASSACRKGVWVELDGSGLDTAGAANMLTSTQGTAPATAVIMHGVGVQVSRLNQVSSATC